MFQNITQIMGNKLEEVKSEGRWHYLAVKKLLALLKEITSKHYGDFYCLNCIHSFRTRSNRVKKKSNKRVIIKIFVT